MDIASSMWGYGFGRIQAEADAEKMRKTRRKKIHEVEPPAIDLEEIRLENSKAIVTLRNTDTRPATVFGVYLWKVLKRPIIRSGLFGEEIWIRKRIDRDPDLKTFTIPPSETISIEMSLTEPLKEQDYVLELYMGRHKEYIEPGSFIQYNLGWAFLLTPKNGGFEKSASMTLTQSEMYWERVRYEVDEWLKKRPRRGKNILLSSSILGILLLPAVPLYINIYLGIIGFIGWILSLEGWKRAKNGKSGSKHGILGGIFMLFTVACLIPGILAIIGGIMSRKPRI